MQCSAQSCLTLCNPMDYKPARLLCPWNFPGKKYWSGLPFPPPGDLPGPGIEPASPALAGRFTHPLEWLKFRSPLEVQWLGLGTLIAVPQLQSWSRNWDSESHSAQPKKQRMTRDFAGSSVVKTLLLMQGAWVQFLVRELRAYTPHSTWPWMT